MMPFLCFSRLKLNLSYRSYHRIQINKSYIMATGNNKNLDKLMNKINTETGRSDAEEILRLQAQRQLKSEHKKVSQMTDFEK